jgi:hypothetical protein
MPARRLAFVAALTAACASAPARPPPAPPPAAPASAPAAIPTAPPSAAATGLAFAVEPREALISIDGGARGTVADLAGSGGVLSLPPGIYQVSLASPGYVTWRAEVAVRSAVERIDVRLVKKP